MANTRLTRTVSSAGSRTTWTLSMWVKRGSIGVDQKLFGKYTSSSNRLAILFNNADQLQIFFGSSGGNKEVVTARKFRDTSAWYHILFAADTTSGTASDRLQIWINGIKETAWGAETQPGQNDDLPMNSTGVHEIGAYNGGNYFNGIISHINFSDGNAYNPSVFGQTDSTTGEWKIKASPSFTPGTNGYSILKNGNGVTDVSANSNNWSVNSGTLTTTKDCPDNNFTTMNPVDVTRGAGNIVYANGNTTVSISNSERNASRSSLAFTAGKFYAECKVISIGGDLRVGVMGIDGTAAQPVSFANNTNPYSFEYGYSYRNNGQKENNNSASSYGASYGNGDIIGVAFNATNGSITFYKNGASQGVAFSSLSSNYWAFYCTLLSTASVAWNFGNGFFGTTAITTNSGNGYAGADGKSKFNYAVPSAHSALSTKGLNT